MNEQVTVLRAARLERGWSLAQLVRLMRAEAERQEVRIGTHPKSLRTLATSWEAGRRTPRAVYVKILAAVYGVTAGELGLPEPKSFSLDNEQLADLFAEYRGFVWGWLYRRVGRDCDLAEDLTMETFIRVGESLAREPGGRLELESPHKFLAVKARWALSEYYGSQRRNHSKHERLLTADEEGMLPDFAATDDFSRPEEIVTGDLNALDLVAGLTDNERELVVLRFFDRLPMTTIQKRMGLSQSQSYTLLRKALATMRANAVVVWDLPVTVEALETAA
ncbi:sigma-70 family RNA polymerase sigma factor [Streptomyces sp. NPDC049906]|uniref:sigma-70 family RNA polymerase sigma factor n=1 Tax=Streptomyces sp. NPDC049906 TaxID=3155656 RepID=UPI00343E7EE4